MEIDDILKHYNTFKYMLLGRMKCDCESYINGIKHLFYPNIAKHIQAMKDIWNSFSDNEKPEWLSLEDICNYENK